MNASKVVERAPGAVYEPHCLWRPEGERMKGDPKVTNIDVNPDAHADPVDPGVPDPDPPAGVRAGRKLGRTALAAGAREGSPAPARGTRPAVAGHCLRRMARPRGPVREAGIRIAASGYERGNSIVPTEKGDR